MQKLLDFLKFTMIVGTVCLGFYLSKVTFFEGVEQIKILKYILLMLTLLSTSLLFDYFSEKSFIRKKLSSIELDQKKIVSDLANSNKATLDQLVISRQSLEKLETRVEGAKSISIYGGSLSRLANEYANVFEGLAKDGVNLRFLLTDPESTAVDYFSTIVTFESQSSEDYRNQLKASIAKWKKLQKSFGSNCSVRLTKNAFPFGIMIVESKDGASSMNIELYGHNIPARERPILAIEAYTDPRLFKQFSSQFDAIWADATEIKVK